MPILKKKNIKELFGIVIIAITVFFSISLISYSPDDPSFKRHVSSSKEIGINNYGGLVGAYLSDGLVQLFGSSAYAAPFFILLIGVSAFLERNVKDYLLLFLGGLSFCIFLSSLIYLYFNTVDPLFGSSLKAGGISGYLISEVLMDYFNRTGAIIIIITAILSSIIITTRFSFIAALSRLCGMVMGILSIIKTYLTIFTARIRKRREIKKIRGSEENKKRKGLPKISVKNTGSGDKIDRKDEAVQEQFRFMDRVGGYHLPPLSLLESPAKSNRKKQEEAFVVNSTILEKKLRDFGADGKVVQIIPGPVITRYEFEPASGVKVSKIMGLSDDLAMGMRALSIRILAPVPGKAVVGIEIPNVDRETIYLKEILSSDDFQKKPKSSLFIALGKNISGDAVITDLAQIPHLLAAGATGSGKSVGVNSMICSLLFTKTPEDVNFLMIDPKMIELSIYDGIPHLIAPVVTNPKKAAAALKWAVEEMEKRYMLLGEKGVRNIASYNKLIDEEAKKSARGKTEDTEEGDKTKSLPFIVVVIDELADLMMVSSRDVEASLTRLAQMARAAGIHLLLATQRPSVDVLTGIIKANFPARISFQVTSRTDSRTILDSIGAEKLLGKGDMLFLPQGTSRLERIHGPLVSEVEIKRMVKFIKKQRKPLYDESIVNFRPSADDSPSEESEYDEKYDEAVALVAKTGQASISMIQRRLRVGYNRAARIIEIMEKDGVIGQSDGVKPRQVFVKDIG